MLLNGNRFSTFKRWLQSSSMRFNISSFFNRDVIISPFEKIYLYISFSAFLLCVALLGHLTLTCHRQHREVISGGRSLLTVSAFYSFLMSFFCFHLLSRCLLGRHESSELNTSQKCQKQILLSEVQALCKSCNLFYFFFAFLFDEDICIICHFGFLLSFILNLVIHYHNQFMLSTLFA